jgi:CO/xanthine dehydrogenase Mo-binding subunit
VQVKGVPGRARPVGALAELGAQFGGRYPPVHGHGRNAVIQQSPMFTVHLCRVRVDADTGGYRVTDYVAVQDVGKAINPPEIEGQVHGGALQGVARGLGEVLAYSEDGQLRTGSFVDYGLPSIDQAPPVEVQLLEIPSPIGPYGAKGVGEPPAVPGPAALANAIAAASGVRPQRLPIDGAALAR